MDLVKNGKLLRELRISVDMTQKQLAQRLGVVAKTVSKWETGHGFPDVSHVSHLAEILGVSEKTILSGSLVRSKTQSGNVKNTKFCVCSCCGSITQGTGEYQAVCCGKPLNTLKSKVMDDNHTVNISTIENDFYIEFSHPMTKVHYISFVAYVACDRVLTVKLYPEQEPTVRFPKMYGGKLYYYCNVHGLFESK